ncbi:MAG: response regulator [Candidatus Nanopelagicales bacterium]
MLTVMVCDDDAMTRESMRRTVAEQSGVARVITAGSGEEALARYEVDRPDLVLMDVRMPGIGGVEALRRLRAQHSDAVVVMLTTAGDPDAVGMAIEDGARGYLAKDASAEELAATIALVLGASAPPSHAPQFGDRPELSEREVQVLEGMSRGLSNSAIGHELYLSEDTVKTHARRLYRKLGAADRAEAVASGFRWGLLE